MILNISWALILSDLHTYHLIVTIIL